MATPQSDDPAPLQRRADDWLSDEEHVQDVFLHAPVAQLVGALDDGRIIAVNEELCRLLGYDERELLSRDMYWLVHPEEVSAVRREVRRPLAGRLPAGGVRRRLIRRDGSVVSVRAFLAPLVAEGPPRYGHVVVLDDREGDELRARVARAERLLETVLQRADDVLLELDPSGRILRASGQAAGRLASGDLHGRDLMELVPPEDAARLRQALTRVAVEGSPEERALVRTLGGETRRSWRMLLRPVPELAAGAAVVAVLHDETEEVQARALWEGEARLLRRVVQGAPSDALLVEVAELVEEHLPGALCSILVVDGDRLRHGAAPSLPAHYVRAVDGLRVAAGHGSCSAAVAEGVPVVVEDIRADARWAPYRHLAARAGLGSCWSLPVRDPHGGVAAAFAIYRRAPQRPSSFEWEWVHRLAAVVAIVLASRPGAPQRHPRAAAAAERGRVELLTGEERAVLRLVGLGHSNREIAEALHVSLRTIEGVRAALTRKLGAERRADLVRAALDAGLLH